MHDLALLLQDISVGPTPGQEVYWILGLLAAAVSALFWQLLKAKDDYTKSCLEDKKICMAALEGLNAATAALTIEMKNENANIARRQEAIIERLDDIQRGAPSPSRSRSR